MEYTIETLKELDKAISYNSPFTGEPKQAERMLVEVAKELIIKAFYEGVKKGKN